jgi:hypothetical protein
MRMNAPLHCVSKESLRSFDATYLAPSANAFDLAIYVADDGRH